MLRLWRRHTSDCPHRGRGRDFIKCSCPVWVDGEVRGQRVRQSLKTRDWARAGRRAAELESEIESGRVRKPIMEAAEAFIAQCGVAPATTYKYQRLVGVFTAFLAGRLGLSHVDEIDLEAMDAYQASRDISPLTWSKELQILRQFLSFCLDRKWIQENAAAKVKMPTEPRPREREPYSTDEITRILSACDVFGKSSYERLRARAMVLLLRHYAFRISDLAVLSRDRIQLDSRHGWVITLHTQKNGMPVWAPLYPEVKNALECLPIPMGAPADCKWYFWSGISSRESVVKTIERTLQAVFRKSGVERALAHRFRHTLATEILVKGGTIEDAANVLGDSPAVIRRYYAKWSVAYRDRTVEVLQRVHGTPLAQTENRWVSPAVSTVRMVAKVGVEPTRTVKCARF